jgi:hypothetical protein
MASTVLLGPAAGAVSNIPTSLSLSASKTHVHKGHDVTFTIRLSSQNRKCKAHQEINWYRNGVLRRTFTTNDNGVVKFTKRQKSTASYYAKYPGRRFGTHPNVHHCLASKSNTVKITVSG